MSLKKKNYDYLRIETNLKPHNIEHELSKTQFCDYKYRKLKDRTT